MRTIEGIDVPQFRDLRDVTSGPGGRRITALAVDLPLLYVPYLFVRDHGLRVTRMVADALGAELGL